MVCPQVNRPGNMLRQRLHATSDNMIMKINPKAFLRRVLYADAKIGFDLTMPVEESVRGNILHLSHTSFRFRCHYASINASSTIELCSREHTIALFGTTNATIICHDGPSVVTTRKKEQNAPKFDC